MDQHGFTALPGKIHVIPNFRQPRIIRALREFLEMVNFYHGCSARCAQTLLLLTDLLKV